MAKKKWLSSIDEQTISWIQEVKAEVGLAGGTIIDELVLRERQNKNSRFRQDLVQARLRLQLQKINDEEMELQARRAELTKMIKSERAQLVNA